MNDSVIWNGPVGADEVWDYYFSCDLFVLPSYDENFGMVVAEAMACGLPALISKNVDIFREVRADNAGFVINQDVDEIVSVLKKLAQNTKILDNMSQNARKSAEDRYDINRAACLMKAAYEDILSRKRSPQLQWK